MIRKEVVQSDFISFIRSQQIRASQHIDLNLFISQVRRESNWSSSEWTFFWDALIPRMLRSGLVTRRFETGLLYLTELGEASIY